MYRTYFFALMLFAMSCTNSTSKVGEDQQSSQQIEYVMNDSLSTDFYTDMKSYYVKGRKNYVWLCKDK